MGVSVFRAFGTVGSKSGGCISLLSQCTNTFRI